jgi:hypothetical protein
MTDMDLAAIDRELTRYRAAADAVSANLLELDADPNPQLLDTAPLTGVTGAAWADARDALTSVWDWFARLTGFLDRAGELRVSPRTRLAPGRQRELAAFLTGPSIEVARSDVPLLDRDLLQPRQATNRCTADELLAAMTDAFARARDVVARVATAWDDFVPRLTTARGRLVDLPASDAQAAVRAHLDALSDALVADPLAVAVDDVAGVEADIDLLVRSARERDDLRREVQARLTDARTRVDDLAGRADTARRAWEATRAKIAEPQVPAPPVTDPSLAGAIAAIADRADAGHWVEASGELDAVVADLDALTARLETSTAESRAALAQRDHLRGRLDAYRAKAHGLGLDEDDDVTAAYERAQGALYVAPADLTEASALVEDFQRLLTPTPEPEARR